MGESRVAPGAQSPLGACCARCASVAGRPVSWRSRRPSSTPSRPGRPRDRFRRTTTRSTASSSCASRPSCGSSDWSSAATSASSKLGRVFRNEGVSPRHNPEFTMLELYAAYWNVRDMMAFTEELVAGVALDVLGTTETTYQGRAFSFAAPWPRRPMAELASEAVGEDVSVHTQSRAPGRTWRASAACRFASPGAPGAARRTLRSDV